jgi:FAD/FMN-containing dehydrogenase
MSQIVIEYFHGAGSRVGISDTACTFRDTGFNVVIISQWTDPKDTVRGKAWARDTYDVLKPHFGKTRYLNYLEEDAAETAAAIYGPNYNRLREIKRKYDPENVFKANVNIAP